MSAAGRALKLGVGASPGSGMAKVLLLGVVLLGCLVLTGGSGDSACEEPVIEWSTPEDANTIRLHCCVTRNVTSLYWSHNGYRLPVDLATPDRQFMEVPIAEATGMFECHVEYSPTLIQSATIVFNFSAKKEPPMSTGMVLMILMGVFSLVLVVMYMGFILRLSQLRYTLRGRRFYRRDGSSNDEEADDGANHATAAV